MKPLYKVHSRWSSEYVAASSIEEAIKKYYSSVKKTRKTAPELTEIDSVELIGELINY